MRLGWNAQRHKNRPNKKADHRAFLCGSAAMTASMNWFFSTKKLKAAMTSKQRSLPIEPSPAFYCGFLFA